MENKQRKEGWYWVKITPKSRWIIRCYNGELWLCNGGNFNDEFFHSINEQRINTPDEPSVLDKAIEIIEHSLGKTAANRIINKLKSENK